MPDMLRATLPGHLTFELPAADAADAVTDPVPVSGLAVPWNTTARMNAWGDTLEFAPGSITVGDPSRVKFAGDHRTNGRAGPVVFGYGVAFESTDAGLDAAFAVPRSELEDPEVARIVRQMGNGVRDALSVGVEILEADETRTDDSDPWAPIHYRVTAAELLEVSSVVLPMFTDARHDRVAASADTATDGTRRFRLTATTAPTQKDTDMPDTLTVPDRTDTAPTTDPDRTAAHAVTVVATATTPTPAPAHPLARFSSFGEYALARFYDPTVPMLQAALADQIPVNNQGVMPPSWLSDVFGIVDLGRPFITSLGGAMDPGATGMTFHWPYFDGDLYALIAEQTAPKTEITSVRVDIKQGTGALKTYAGGSDIALQLIERSDPSYLTSYLNIMSAAFAAVTDRAAITAAATVATGTVAADGTTGNQIAAALFEASVAVQRATGLPASVVAVSSDLFPLIAAAVMSTTSPRDNTAAAGADASTLEVTLAGLDVTHVPGAAPGTVVVTNGQAFRWAEDGPRTIDALEVAKLGRDVAVYGYAGPAPFIPAGIVEVTGITAPAAASRRK